MKKIILTLVFLVGGGVLPSLVAGSLQEQVEKETAKREQALQPLREAFESSRRLVADGKSKEACEALAKAFEVLPETLQDTSLALDVKKLWQNLRLHWRKQPASKTIGLRPGGEHFPRCAMIRRMKLH